MNYKKGSESIYYLILTILLVFLLVLKVNRTNQDFYNWKGIRSELRDTITLFIEYGEITDSIIGHSGNTSKQWFRRKWIMDYADSNELYRLISHPKSIVKLTAYEGLLRNKDSFKFEILKNAMRDTTSIIFYQSCCTSFPLLIGEYLSEEVFLISDLVPPPKPLQFDF